MHQSNFLMLDSIVKNEILAGYLTGNSLSGFVRLDSKILLATRGKKYGMTSWILPTNLDGIANQLGKHVNSADFMLEHNTLFPAFKRFLPDADLRLLDRHHRHEAIRGVSSKVGLAGASASSWQFRICLGCVKSDVTVSGRIYLRRNHFMPGILVCALHREELRVVCKACRPRYEVGNSDSDRNRINCICALSTKHLLHNVSDRDLEHELDIANGFDSLLNSSRLAHVNRDHVISTITRQSRALGLVKGDHLDRKRYFELASDPSFGQFIKLSALPGNSLKNISEVLIGKTLQRNPVATISLLRGLFGDWKNAEYALIESRPEPAAHSKQALANIRSKATLPLANELPPTHKERRIPSEDAVLDAYRQHIDQYRNLLQTYPHLPHSTIVRQMPWGARILTRERLAWLGEPLPPASRGAEYRMELDASLSMHVREQYELLVRTEVTFRISHRVLLRGHRMVSLWKSIKDTLPQTLAALRECEETFEVMCRRRLKIFVKRGLVPGVGPDSVNAVDEMDQREILRLTKKVQRAK